MTAPNRVAVYFLPAEEKKLDLLRGQYEGGAFTLERFLDGPAGAAPSARKPTREGIARFLEQRWHKTVLILVEFLLTEEDEEHWNAIRTLPPARVAQLAFTGKLPRFSCFDVVEWIVGFRRDMESDGQARASFPKVFLVFPEYRRSVRLLRNEADWHTYWTKERIEFDLADIEELCGKFLDERSGNHGTAREKTP